MRERESGERERARLAPPPYHGTTTRQAQRLITVQARAGGLRGGDLAGGRQRLWRRRIRHVGLLLNKRQRVSFHPGHVLAIQDDAVGVQMGTSARRAAGQAGGAAEEGRGEGRHLVNVENGETFKGSAWDCLGSP